jgi:hypothetical protein
MLNRLKMDFFKRRFYPEISVHFIHNPSINKLKVYNFLIKQTVKKENKEIV